jgi:hypothetical protein
VQAGETYFNDKNPKKVTPSLGKKTFSQSNESLLQEKSKPFK